MLSIRIVRFDTLVVEVAGASIVPVACAVVIVSGPSSAPRPVITRALAISAFTVSPTSSTVSAMSATPASILVSPGVKMILKSCALYSVPAVAVPPETVLKSTATVCAAARVSLTVKLSQASYRSAL